MLIDGGATSRRGAGVRASTVMVSSPIISGAPSMAACTLALSVNVTNP